MLEGERIRGSCDIWRAKEILLYLLYINDLPQNLQAPISLFAGDTAVYLKVRSSDDRDTVQADLNTLQEWEQAWDMEFNPSKRLVIHTSIEHPVPQANVRCSTHPLNTQYLKQM